MTNMSPWIAEEPVERASDLPLAVAYVPLLWKGLQEQRSALCGVVESGLMNVIGHR